MILSSRTTIVWPEKAYQEMLRPKTDQIRFQFKLVTLPCVTNLRTFTTSKSIVDNFAEQQYNFMKEESVIVWETPMKSIKTHGMELRTKDFDANVAGIPETISYFYGFAEGEENLYTIMAWTSESKKDSFKDEVERMIKSIKEL